MGILKVSPETTVILLGIGLFAISVGYYLHLVGVRFKLVFYLWLCFALITGIIVFIDYSMATIFFRVFLILGIIPASLIIVKIMYPKHRDNAYYSPYYAQNREYYGEGISV